MIARLTLTPDPLSWLGILTCQARNEGQIWKQLSNNEITNTMKMTASDRIKYEHNLGETRHAWKNGAHTPLIVAAFSRLDRRTHYAMVPAVYPSFLKTVFYTPPPEEINHVERFCFIDSLFKLVGDSGPSASQITIEDFTRRFGGKLTISNRA